MKSLNIIAVAALLILPAAASAASIDMNDPRRALGRLDDVRIDAQILQDTVAPGTPITVTYQIQNFSDAPVAVADRIADASYDPDTQTITLSLGSEVPPDGNMPQVVTIGAGEKKVFRAAATPALSAAEVRAGRMSGPRYVRIKVSILRNLEPFMTLIRNQSRVPQALSDEQFDSWFTSKETIFLNAVPVQFSPGRNRGISADRNATAAF